MSTLCKNPPLAIQSKDFKTDGGSIEIDGACKGTAAKGDCARTAAASSEDV